MMHVAEAEAEEEGIGGGHVAEEGDVVEGSRYACRPIE